MQYASLSLYLLVHNYLSASPFHCALTNNPHHLPTPLFINVKNSANNIIKKRLAATMQRAATFFFTLAKSVIIYPIQLPQSAPDFSQPNQLFTSMLSITADDAA